MSTVTRFAPSPTGFLHIGGARTALFNFLYARHTGGAFRLRIEDTDRKRSTDEAKEAIIDGLAWLGIEWDGDIVYQSARADRHAEAAKGLLAEGKAYHCYCTQEELAAMRDRARAEGGSRNYDGRWRDRDPSEAPAGVPPVVRLKMPLEGETVIADRVQGEVRIAHEQLDDMVLLRADGTPTYMLSVVIDDHDMGVSHIIRGDDHLTNAFRQIQLFRALGWEPPVFAHVPLIHGPDGARMSKRHGALGVEAYRDMGILPEALRNYLLRLGWSHGDDEIIDTAQSIDWFELDGIGRSPARFDMAKLESVNGHYLHETDDERLAGLVAERLADKLGREPDAAARERLRLGMGSLKQRAKTLVELTENACFYAISIPLPMSEKAARILDEDARTCLASLIPRIEALSDWTEDGLAADIRAFADAQSPPMKLGKIAQPLRAALTGDTASPGIFEVLAVLGREEALARMRNVVK